VATDNAAADIARSASLTKRVLSLVYETLLLAAVLFAGTLPILLLMQHIEAALARPLLQLYLLALCGGYFVWQWRRGGQTLPMKSWRLRLVTRDGAPLTPRHAIYRFIFALLSLALVGTGFLWALFDRDRQFLHDRLAGTRIINDERGTV
jgi:uncharacterized RDD family membrane protein YckC